MKKAHPFGSARTTTHTHAGSTRPVARVTLFAVHTEVIVRHGRGAVGIYRYVHGLVHQKVVSRALADNSEVVHEGQAELAILQRLREALLSHARRLIFISTGLTSSGDTLRLEMRIAADVVPVDCKSDQRVEGAS